MGRELRPVGKAPAGMVVGIAGLGAHVIKTVTLSTTLACPSFTPMYALPVLAVCHIAGSYVGGRVNVWFQVL